ncbi:MAG TPA: MBL fold metallo-hydrolase [Allosphingosinicella sp.]|nr:MBL fold metallo-hydrolase [Allosphingosinicella sp.]
MKTLLRRLGTLLLFVAAALCFAPTLIPPFLDRIYYRGPPSDHFDGRHFFNPEDRSDPIRHVGSGFAARWATGQGRVKWPDRVPVTPTKPPARVEGSRMLVTWIGHSTVLVQTAGLNILTDPIWSERASPFSFTGPKRVRAPGVRLEDLPKIDLILISHNHYDHLDLPTLKRLWERDRPAIVTSLGNDTILRNRGIPSIAADWEQSVPVRGISVTPEQVHHWGSRWGTDRNRALWSGFTVATPSGKVFFAGDTGWGDGIWPVEAAKHGPFRFAILPIGAYLPREVMASNHMDPEESVAAFQRLGAKTALGVHWGTFQLTFEGIDDPPRRLAAALKGAHIPADRFVTTEVGQTFEVP